MKVGDKVLVRGLDMAFVVARHIDAETVQLLIEGENLYSPHYVVSARIDVLLPNDYESAVAA